MLLLPTLSWPSLPSPLLGSRLSIFNVGHRNNAEDGEDVVERPGIYDMKMSLFSKHHPQSHHHPHHLALTLKSPLF